MGRFQGPTAKCHRIWSNCLPLVQSIMNKAGYLCMEERRSFTKTLVKTYVDSNGVRRCTGIKDDLKASQLLGIKV